MTDLKPCPFCGSSPKLDQPSMSASGWQVFCPKCETVATRVLASGAEAIAAWNTRAPVHKA